MLQLKKSKLTCRVGVASEAKRLASSISIPRQASDPPKIRTSEIHLKDTHHAQLLEMNENHFPEKPVKAVVNINDLNAQGKNLVMASRIVNQHPPIPLSSPLLKNGFHTITYLDLLSLEKAHTTSQLANVRKSDKHFKTGWLHDEVINSFLHILTSKSFYSVSQAQRWLFRKVNHFLNFGKMKNYLQSRVSSSHLTLTTVTDF